MSRTEWPGSASTAARTNYFDGRVAADTSREIPVETPVNIIYGVQPFAVMMTTPRDLEDFAYGFSVTEGVIDQARDIQQVHIREQRRGIELLVSLASGVVPRMRVRNTAGRTGCGLCGIDQLDALPAAAMREHARAPVAMLAIRRALDALDHRQILNQSTHAVHAAAWCASNGDIVALREDVGRHNALDKLIGALLRSGHAPDDGFVVITSRCSFEMVEKAAVFGASTIVAISAPTSLAVERAAVHGMILVAVARRDSALVFHGAERIHDESVASAVAGDQAR